MIKLIRFLTIGILSIQCMKAFAQMESQEQLLSVSPDVAVVASIDSWKCTEYIPKIDPKCRFRAIYINPLKSEAMPRLEVEILEWTSYINPTMRLAAKKSIDVNSNKQTATEAGKLEGERSIGCCRLSNVRWEGLKLKYDARIGEKIFYCELNRLAERNFDVDCKDRIE
jgi:hypothetical protein